MSYRPITDMWILARAKLKPNEDGTRNTYYGSYLGGFPERARALLGCKITDPVLHVCGGKAKAYPYKRGFGPHDKTLDLDPSLNPDFLRDAREPWPFMDGWTDTKRAAIADGLPGANNPAAGRGETPWAGILIDPPYSPEDAEHYAPGADKLPTFSLLLRNAFEVLPLGGRVGLICYHLPKPPPDAIFVACVGVGCGFGNRIRCYTVFEKPTS